MRVAAYIRVSTDEQADKGNSLTEQKERLSAYCTAMGWNSPVFYIDDGYSAKNLKRPGIQNLIHSVECEEFDIVLTAKIDRLCRNLLDLLKLVDLLEQYNCSYVSSSEKFDTSTANGRLTLQLLGTFAEFERGRISERVKDNMLSLSRNTDKALTRPCFGYDIVDGRYCINADEAKDVNFMFELAEQGYGHRMIAKMLNDKGSTTKRGKKWDQTNVKRLMSTETITGTMIYNKRETSKGKLTMRDKEDWIIKENNHPAIITIERYERVQEIFRSRSRAHKHAENESYILTGLVRCKYCGGSMKGNTSRNKRKTKTYTYYRYICSSYVAGYGCKYHAVHRDDLETKIIRYIKDVASSSHVDVKMAVANSRSVESEVKELRAQLARTNKQMQKQIEAYEEDLITPEDLKMAKERVEAKRANITAQLAKLEKQNGDVKAVKQNAKKMIDDLTDIDRMKAKNALRQLLDQIIVADDQISVVWKFL